MALADRLYRRLPVLGQHAAVTAFGLVWHWRRFGGGYANARKGFIERESYGLEQWARYQRDQLRELLQASMRTPYYRDRFTRSAIDRFELDDLSRIPILEKAETRKQPEAFLIDDVDVDKLTICATSGSSGTPVRTYWSNADFRRSLALREARACRPAGVSYREPRATFSGRLVVPDANSNGPFHRFNLVERQVYFSAFHIAPQNAKAYVDALNRHGIVWCTGYTHAYEQLGAMMLEQGIPPPPTVRAVITTSEKLTQGGRTIIEQAFGARVFEEYGQVEDACWACERPDGRLHVSPDAGILELVRPDGTSIPYDDPTEGQVVATSLIRRSQIFLRYRVGDMACWDVEATRQLGTPVLREISGRIEDVVIAPDGRRTVRFHGIFTELPAVREAQVIQEAVDRLRIRVVGTAGYGSGTAEEIVRRVHARLTTSMRVEVERVDSIPRTSAGKFQAVINRVPR